MFSLNSNPTVFTKALHTSFIAFIIITNKYKFFLSGDFEQLKCRKSCHTYLYAKSLDFV